MKIESIKICPEISDAELICYYNSDGIKRDALLILPGGGYNHLCLDREGDYVAQAFLALGFNCFILKYSLKENAVFPRPLIEASKAMQYIRENAVMLNINPSRVFSLGFSAGGHLCASLGTLWHTVDCVPEGINKPTGIILGYPVITDEKGITHKGSFIKIIGKENPTEEETAKYSLEKQVDQNTSPAFIFHSADDSAVSCQNSLMFAKALSENKIPLELHIFPSAPHGFALANELSACSDSPKMINERIAQWPRLAAEWTKTIN